MNIRSLCCWVGKFLGCGGFLLAIFIVTSPDLVKADPIAHLAEDVPPFEVIACVDLGCGCNQPAPGECGCDNTVQMDECGFCGGDGPGECGCNIMEFKDSCGVCGGDGSSCQEENREEPTPEESCTYTFHRNDVRPLSDPEFLERSVFSGEGASLTCLESVYRDHVKNEIDERLDYLFDIDSRGLIPAPRYNPFRTRLSEEEMELYQQIVDTHADTIRDFYDKLAEAYIKNPIEIYVRHSSELLEALGLADEFASLPQEVQRFLDQFPDSDHLELLVNPGYFDDFVANELYETFAGNNVVDSNCQPIRKTNDVKICGGITVQYYVSPISLIWNGEKRLDQDLTVVDFKLNPTENSKWYTWKASANAPLLVLLPKDRDTIDSGSQLFGHWTELEPEKVVDSSNQTERGRLWTNGFEALAALDQNNDKEISGTELEGIGLWFDRNRNGISEKDEVTSLVEEQVTALFYETDYTDSANNDIYALRGFERIVDGEKVVGTAVDWFAAEADSREELVSRFLNSFKLDALSEKSVAQKTTHIEPRKGNEAKALKDNEAKALKDNEAKALKDNEAKAPKRSEERARNSLSGVWRWNPEGGNDRPSTNGGMLILKERDGILTGRTVVEAPLQNNPDGMRSVIASFPIEGSVTRSDNGDSVFKFKVDQGSTTLESEGVLDQLTGKIVGQTKATGKVNGVQTALGYTWNARKGI